MNRLRSDNLSYDLPVIRKEIETLLDRSMRLAVKEYNAAS